MQHPIGDSAAAALEILAAADRRLGEARERLADASARSGDLSAATTWRTDAATVFHQSAGDLRADVAVLAAALEDARAQLSRTRLRIDALTWSGGR